MCIWITVDIMRMQAFDVVVGFDFIQTHLRGLQKIKRI